jgi:hypothetical protein
MITAPAFKSKDEEKGINRDGQDRQDKEKVKRQRVKV